MNKKDYVIPIIFGIMAIFIVLFFKDYLLKSLELRNFAGEIFTFSSTLFGLILTAYSMFFGVIPALNKEFRKWSVLKDINYYFLSCLISLLIGVVLSIIYMFNQGYVIFSINFIFLAINLGFFVYIVVLVKEIFYFVSEEGN